MFLETNLINFKMALSNKIGLVELYIFLIIKFTFYGVICLKILI